MCDVIAAVAVAGVAVSAAGAVAGNQAASKAAAAQSRYGHSVATQNMVHRVEVMQYQNEVWQQDLDYANELLQFAETEWNRQAEHHGRARDAIEKNTLAGIGQVLIRQVEEDMLTVMSGQETRKRGTAARASIAARDNGVEGNSVDAIINDVSRQEGEVLNVMAMNRAAGARALNREAVALDAQGDQQLASLQLKTYAPQSQIRMPAPVSPTNPAAPVAGPSNAQLITGVAGAVMGGVSNYSSWSGQTTGQTFNQMGNWFSRQFTTTPTTGASGMG